MLFKFVLYQVQWLQALGRHLPLSVELKPRYCSSEDDPDLKVWARMTDPQLYLFFGPVHSIALFFFWNNLLDLALGGVNPLADRLLAVFVEHERVE